MKDKNQMTAVIASFEDRRRADHFVHELRQAGFRDDEVGMIAPHEHQGDTKMEKAAATGAVTGGAVGALTGAVATGLIPGVGPVVATGLLAGALGGTAVGAAAGGLLGALVTAGAAEDEARRHEEEFLAGRTLVVVQALGRGAEALAILHRQEPRNGASRVDEAATTPPDGLHRPSLRPHEDYVRELQEEYEEQQEESKI